MTKGSAFLEKSTEIDGRIVTVTDDGTVFLDNKQMSIQKTKNGYSYVQINGTNYLVHRLVADLFICPLKRNDRSIQVHHINQNKDDNRVDNLIVMSTEEHQRLHKRLYPYAKTCIVCGSSFIPNPTKRKRSKVCSKACKIKLDKINAQKRKKPICQYDLSCNKLAEWDSARDIRNKLGIFESNINKCCRGTIKSYKGFVWKYKET